MGMPLLRFTAVVAASLVCTPAAAQYLDPMPRVPLDRDIPVANREPPGYEAPGIPLGGFTLHPQVRGMAVYSDNVFASETGAEDDIAFRIAPSLRLSSGWSRHSLQLRLASEIDRYASLTSENSERYDADAVGLVEAGSDTILRARVRWQKLQEARSSQNSFTQTLEPIRYEMLTGAAGITQDLGRLRLSVEGAGVKTDYANARNLAGGLIDTRARDNTTLSVRARAEYQQSPSVGYFVQGTFNDRDFEAASAFRPKRDSKGYELLAGISFELSALARGEVGVGWLKQSFDDPFYRDSSNLGLNGRVLLFPSRLTTVTVEADRRVENSGNPASGAYLSTEAEVRIDHELLRTLIIGASAAYQKDQFNDIDRDDKRWALGLRAEYRLTRNLALEATASHLDVSSAGIDRYRSYNENRVLLGLSIRG